MFDTVASTEVAVRGVAGRIRPLGRWRPRTTSTTTHASGSRGCGDRGCTNRALKTGGLGPGTPARKQPSTRHGPAVWVVRAPDRGEPDRRSLNLRTGTGVGEAPALDKLNSRDFRGPVLAPDQHRSADSNLQRRSLPRTGAAASSVFGGVRRLPVSSLSWGAEPRCVSLVRRRCRLPASSSYWGAEPPRPPTVRTPRPGERWARCLLLRADVAG